jgi:colanic acid biosynthesis glycosyl transferase WcaI
LLDIIGMLVRFIYSRCDLLLSPSRLLIPRLASYCNPGQRIEYFPNWVESAYETLHVTPAPEVKSSSGSFTVMFAGNIGEAQDFPAILKAADRLRDRSEIRWIIVGDGRAEPWVRAEISRRGLEDNMLLIGRFPPERMPSLFQHADALLVSLKADPIFAMTAPGKIQSYLAFGRPILAMLDGEGATVVEDAKAGLSSPAGDSERLAANIARLAALSPREREAMGRHGMEYARREFSRTVLVDRLESWLTTIMTVAHGCT